MGKPFKSIFAILIAVIMVSLFITGFTFAESNLNEENIDSVSIVNKEGNNNADYEKPIVEDVSNELNFLYIESPELEAPATQNIVVSWQEDVPLDEVRDITLQIKDADNNVLSIKENKRTDKSILFEKDFDKSDIGKYTITGVKYTVGDIETQLKFNDVEIKATFEVVEASTEVSSIDGVATVEVNSDGTVSKKAVSNEIQAVMSESNTNARATRLGNVVVVLDPGHGGSDSGASANGLREKNLNLKIAQYCKAELSQYSGVTVYMTREDDSDMPGATEAARLQTRVDRAKQYGADILVSIHNNSGGGQGAEIYYPNNNYNASAGAVGGGVATEIQQELVALGLKDRGVKIKNTANGSTYPNGSYSDYYGIIRKSKLAGFPGIIIEHAFIDNASDAAFLSSEVNLKKLGVADATGIAKYFGLSKTRLVTIDDGTYTINFDTEKKNFIFVDQNKSNHISLGAVDNITSSQRFEFVNLGNNSYIISSEETGEVLTIEDDVVQMKARDDGKNQLWQIVKNENGELLLKSCLDKYLYITSENEEGVKQLSVSSNIHEAHSFYFTESDYRPVKDGVYYIKAHNNLNVSVSQASLEDGGNIIVDEDVEFLSGEFQITYNGGGYYSIRAEHSNKVLDVSGGDKKSGANVQQYSPNGTHAQQWKFIENGDGSLYIKSRLGTVLSVSKNNVETSKYGNSENLKWTIEKVNSKPIESSEYVILSSKNNLKALTQNGEKTRINMFENINTQKYIVEYLDSGYYKIINKETGKALGIADVSKSSNSKLVYSDWKNEDKQLWRIVLGQDNEFIIKSKIGGVIDISSGCMDENNLVWTYSYNNTAAQKWDFDNEKTKLSENIIEDGVYNIFSGLDKNKVLDIKSGSLVNQGNVQLYENNDTEAQQFEITYVGNGYYNIINAKSGKALDVAGGSTKNSANLWQYESNGTKAQLWKFISNGNGSYYIKSANGTFIDVAGGYKRNGANVWMYEGNCSAAQKWDLKKNESYAINEGEYTVKTKLNNMRALNMNPNTGNAELGILNYDNNQRYAISYQDLGYCKITNVATGKVLTMEKSDTYKVGNVCFRDDSNDDTQKWKFIEDGTGLYYIRAKQYGALDVNSGNDKEGTNIQVYPMNGTYAQKWDVGDSQFYSITGMPNISVENMARYFNMLKKNYPYNNNSEAPNIEAFINIYDEECKAEGIRTEVAFCQAMKETGWLQFSGDVSKEQYNFAGIGATGNGNPGNSFSSVRIGIRAHIQHLKAYACKDALNNECVDPRFNYVTRGIAPYVEWLGAKENPFGKGWATSENYGQDIVKMIKVINEL